MQAKTPSVPKINRDKPQCIQPNETRSKHRSVDNVFTHQIFVLRDGTKYGSKLGKQSPTPGETREKLFLRGEIEEQGGYIKF